MVLTVEGLQDSLRQLENSTCEPRWSLKIWRFPDMGVPPNHTFYMISHYKPSILGYHHLIYGPPVWEKPCRCHLLPLRSLTATSPPHHEASLWGSSSGKNGKVSWNPNSNVFNLAALESEWLWYPKNTKLFQTKHQTRSNHEASDSETGDRSLVSPSTIFDSHVTM